MANFERIRYLSRVKKISIRQLSRMINKKEGTIQQIMKTGQTNTSTIEQIAKIFEVPVGYFFDDYIQKDMYLSVEDVNNHSLYGKNALGEDSISKDKEIEYLRALLVEKERLLQDKERLIRILMQE